MNRVELLQKLTEMQLTVKRSTTVYRHMRDPALLRYYYSMKMMPVLNKTELVGSSPTDIFVGRYGYPKIFVGPMVPPEFGDTSLLGMPERWGGMSIESIVSMRSKLVRGMYLTNVKNVEKSKFEEQIRDLALAESSTGTEMSFAKKPYVKIELRDEVQPFGPSAEIKNFNVYNIRADKKIESMYLDSDATASTSIIELYNRGVPVSMIQKGLSAGLFGIKENRRFVPTRWSITAVDDTISKRNRELIKSYNSVDAIYAYYNVALDNRWLVFLMPGNWSYESIEAWYPKTIWNIDGKSISIYSSYEGYKGRKDYAEIGGCYYAGRLAVTEKLLGIEKQASVLILREVHEGYLMPVGVWNVREHVRRTLAKEPTVLYSNSEMFDYIKSRLDIPVNNWIVNSRMLSNINSQRRLTDYINKIR